MLMTVHQKELVLGLMKGPVDHWPIGLWIYKEAGSSRSPWRGWNLLDLVTDVQECCQLREKAEAIKISRMIVNFAAVTNADVLVMGSCGYKAGRSNCFQRTTLGSSAHLAALEAPCSVVLIRPGCRVDTKLATVFMVAVDGSLHSQYALQLCATWARPDKDEIVCRVFGPSEFTEPLERMCTDQLQAVMRDKKVEYAVIPTELDESADVHGDDLSEAAQQGWRSGWKRVDAAVELVVDAWRTVKGGVERLGESRRVSKPSSSSGRGAVIPKDPQAEETPVLTDDEVVHGEVAGGFSTGPAGSMAYLACGFTSKHPNS
ncbi:unnamed protein product [Durusdinium trenchii]|uniref:Uncharacterized protein n=1 Tax=Durusdinium trenchii TaxID=1381693 RepID=A0ABP0J580_9DINO